MCFVIMRDRQIILIHDMDYRAFTDNWIAQKIVETFQIINITLLGDYS